jgi:hypothetical protein
MTVEQLIEQLQYMDQGAEVRLAFQPEWPFEYGVGDVVSVNDAESELELVECDGEWYVEAGEEGTVEGPFPTEEAAERALIRLEEKEEAEIGNVVWIGEAGQIGYLPGIASRALGWR